MARLLVVDDEPRYRTQIRRLLEHDGHEVETAADAAAAISISHRFKPEVVIADWMLRDRMSGLDLARNLQTRCPRAVIIIITGYPAERFKDELATLTCALRVLEKPFGLDELQDAVNWACRRGANDEK